MPWVVGIDEAGYGPNLGPLVQAAVALKLPECDPAGWSTLKPAVRRCREKADGRLLIDDSKKVYTRHGLEGLERGVMRLAPWATNVAELVRKTCSAACATELATEAWYNAEERVPLLMTQEEFRETNGSLVVPSYADGRRFTVTMAGSVVPAPRFNRIVDEYGSKGTVLSRGLVELITDLTTHELTGGEPLLFLCDKQGGRNYYAALVQEAFPDGWVVTEKEGAEESRYRVENLPRQVTITFRPRADGDSVSVALASMLCKYLREVCMRQFNRFWAEHVPGIRPTAGYPSDAKRFYDEIRPAMEKLGLTADQVWRKK